MTEQIPEDTSIKFDPPKFGEISIIDDFLATAIRIFEKQHIRSNQLPKRLKTAGVLQQIQYYRNAVGALRWLQAINLQRNDTALTEGE